MALNNHHLTRQHLRGLGLSTYQAIALSKSCPIQGKSGGANLYTIADILQSTQVYLQKSRIKKSTRASLESLIQELGQLQSNVIAPPFGNTFSEVKQTVKALLVSKSETNRFKLRSAALKGGTQHA